MKRSLLPWWDEKKHKNPAENSKMVVMESLPASARPAWGLSQGTDGNTLTHSLPVTLFFSKVFFLKNFPADTRSRPQQLIALFRSFYFLFLATPRPPPTHHGAVIFAPGHLYFFISPPSHLFLIIPAAFRGSLKPPMERPPPPPSV